MNERIYVVNGIYPTTNYKSDTYRKYSPSWKTYSKLEAINKAKIWSFLKELHIVEVVSYDSDGDKDFQQYYKNGVLKTNML